MVYSKHVIQLSSLSLPNGLMILEEVFVFAWVHLHGVNHQAKYDCSYSKVLTCPEVTVSVLILCFSEWNYGFFLLHDILPMLQWLKYSFASLTLPSFRKLIYLK